MQVRLLFEKAEDLDCVMYLSAREPNAQDYIIQRLIVQVISQATIATFIEYAATIGFVNWYPCEEPQTGLLPTYIGKMEISIYGAWMDGFFEHARMNQKLPSL